MVDGAGSTSGGRSGDADATALPRQSRVVPTGALRDGVQAWRVMDHEDDTHERARVIFEPSRDHSPFAITGTSFLHRAELVALQDAIDRALEASA